MSSLGENIKFYRKQKKMTQSDLAEALGVFSTTISAWEVGRNKPLIDKIEMMAKIFNVTKSELLRETIDDFFTNKKDDSNKTLDYLIVILKTLNADRQSKVYDFAMKQLKEQNEENLRSFLYEE